MSNIGRSGITRDASTSTIDHRILFCVDGSLFVIVSHDGCMRGSRKKPVVSLRHNAVITDKHTADLETFTGTPCSSDLRNV